MNSATPKVVVEEILSVSTIRYSIINEKLQNHLDRSLAVERQIFSVASDDFAVLLESLLDCRAIAALVLNKTLWSNIDDVVSCGFAQLSVPA